MINRLTKSFFNRFLTMFAVNAEGQPTRQKESFIYKHCQQIAAHGWRSLWPKLVIGLFFVPAVVVLLIIRLLRPLVLIRFGELSWTRIGHFAMNTEVYLCERDNGLYGKRTVDIFYCSSLMRIVNRQLYKMWMRNLIIFKPAFVLGRVNRLLPGYKAHTVELPSDRDMNGLLALTRPHLFFTDEEETKGQAVLNKLSIPLNGTFVCFHVRDSEYLKVEFPESKWNYHDYKDSRLEDYIPATEALATLGHYVLRMGYKVKDKFPSNNPKVIDYATIARDDFADIYLGGKCSFFLASASGLSGVPLAFRKPVAWSNYVPIEYFPTAYPDTIVIFKKFWKRKERCFMSFRESIKTGVGRFMETEQFEQAGIDVVENTPDEIKDLVIEMDARVKGAWKDTEEDIYLQQNFQSLFKRNDLHGSLRLARAGAAFLRNNKDLF